MAGKAASSYEDMMVDRAAVRDALYDTSRRGGTATTTPGAASAAAVQAGSSYKRAEAHRARMRRSMKGKKASSSSSSSNNKQRSKTASSSTLGRSLLSTSPNARSATASSSRFPLLPKWMAQPDSHLMGPSQSMPVLPPPSTSPPPPPPGAAAARGGGSLSFDASMPPPPAAQYEGYPGEEAAPADPYESLFEFSNPYAALSEVKQAKQEEVRARKARGKGKGKKGRGGRHGSRAASVAALDTYSANSSPRRTAGATTPAGMPLSPIQRSNSMDVANLASGPELVLQMSKDQLGDMASLQQLSSYTQDTSLPPSMFVEPDQAPAKGRKARAVTSYPRSLVAPRNTLKDAVKKNKAITRQLNATKARWDASRKQVSASAQQLQFTQSRIAGALAGEVARARRQHDVIAAAPQASKDAKRLLRMRIEKNFERMVNKWMDERTGWAIRLWKDYVKRHRKYMAWVDEVTPYVVSIQLMYRGWRGRMVFRAAREARRREHRRVGATYMQALYRGYVARDYAKALRERRLRMQQQFAAGEFQRVWRGYYARKRVSIIVRSRLRAVLKRLGFGTLALLYDVIRNESWPDEWLEPLRGAMDVMEESGCKGLAPTRFPQVLEVIDELEELEAERDYRLEQAAQAAEMERLERQSMREEELWQLGNEKVIATRALAIAAEQAEKDAAVAREQAEQQGMQDRKDAVIKKAIEDERKRKADAARELKRRDRLIASQKRRDDRMAELRRKREDDERKRKARLIDKEERSKKRVETSDRKRILRDLKHIKYIRQQEEKKQRLAASKARAARKKKEQAAKKRAEKAAAEKKAAQLAALKEKERADKLREEAAAKGLLTIPPLGTAPKVYAKAKVLESVNNPFAKYAYAGKKKKKN